MHNSLGMMYTRCSVTGELTWAVLGVAGRQCDIRPQEGDRRHEGKKQGRPQWGCTGLSPFNYKHLQM